jgi:nitrite reductase/ring-hydroxylating ferredoxin subunit
MSSYEGNYYKVGTLADLPMDRPRVFRAAGATVILRRAQGGVTAIDGSCLQDAAHFSSEERLRRIIECVADGAGSTSREWDGLLAIAGLPVRIENDEVWVCIESCAQ